MGYLYFVDTLFWVQCGFSREDGRAIGGDIPAVSDASWGLGMAPRTYQWLNNKHTIEKIC